MKFDPFRVPLLVESRPVWAVKKTIASADRVSTSTTEMAAKFCGIFWGGKRDRTPDGSGA
jgi:hypothetical protein